MGNTKNTLEQLAKKMSQHQILENVMTKTLKGGHRGEPPPFEIQL